MTIESSIRNKVIELHTKGKKRDVIAKELNLSGVKISTGSVSNVLKEWRHQQESKNEQPEWKSEELKGATLRLSDSPPSYKAEGFKSAPARLSDSPETKPAEHSKMESDRVTTFTDPLIEKTFLNSKDIVIEDHVITSQAENNWEHNGYSRDAPLSWFLNGTKAVNNRSEDEKKESFQTLGISGGNNTLHTSSSNIAMESPVSARNGVGQDSIIKNNLRSPIPVIGSLAAPGSPVTGAPTAPVTVAVPPAPGSPVTVAGAGVNPLPEINIEPADIINQDQDDIENGTIKEENKTEFSKARHKFRTPAPAFTNTKQFSKTSVDPSNNETAEEENLQNKPSIDWDSEEKWESNLWARIMEERKLREQQLFFIEQGEQELEQKRQEFTQTIEQRNNDLRRREAKLVEIELLIPLARQLQMMKVDVRNFIPWTEVVQEYAMNHNIDLTTAAFDMVKNMRAWKDLETVQNVIKKAEERLKALGIFIRQNESALATLMKLQAMGYSDKAVIELVKLVNSWSGLSCDYRKLDTELIDVRTGCSENGQRKNNLKEVNGHGISLSKINQIMLKQRQLRNANMLNRMSLRHMVTTMQ